MRLDLYRTVPLVQILGPEGGVGDMKLVVKSEDNKKYNLLAAQT